MRILNWREKSKKTADIFITLAFLATQMFGVGLVLATEQAAAAPTCVNDTAGANDEPGQKDLTRLCTDTTGLPTSEQVIWNWDSLGTSGNNTMDACGLFDTDGDSNANNSICVTTNNSPATLGLITIYTCNDSKQDRCGSPNSVIPGPYSTTCTVNQQSTDPFAAGDFAPTDTVATCNFVLADINKPSAILTDVCSYPSNQPGSDPSDCVIQTSDPVALVELKKALNPTNDPGRFNLTVDGPDSDDTSTVTNQGNGGTTGIVGLNPGTGNGKTATVSEAAFSGTSLSTYNSSISCVKRGTTTVVTATGSGPSWQIPIKKDDNIVCTITNTRLTGTLQVVKDVVNDSGGTKTFADFHFSVNGGSNQSFLVTTSPDGSKSLTVPTGTYTVTEPEENTLGYSTSYNNCTSVTVSVGQTTTCTITNNDVAGTLTLNKTVTNSYGGNATTANFQAKVDGNNVAWGASNSVTAGQAHTLSEAVLAGGSGYSASVWTCTGGMQSGSQITVALGQSASCSITNTDIQPQLTVIKHVVNSYGGNATSSNFLMSITGTNVSNGSFAGADTPGTTVTLNAGSYSVGETGVMGYTPSYSADCNGTVAVGQTKTCTVTNTQQPGAISGFKYEVNADSSQVKALGGWVIYIDANNNNMYDTGEAQTSTLADGSYGFTNLFTNVVYNVREVLQAGWTQIFGASNPVSVTSGHTTTTGTNFGNFQNASISGLKFNDVNGNGTKDAADTSLAGWTIQLKNSSNVVVASTVTTVAGYGFTNVAPGTYTVCEVGQSGWTQTYPASNGCHTVVINLSNETNPDINFGNFQSGSVSGYKWNDVNGNGTYDNEPKLNGWTIFIDGNNNGTLDQGETSTTTSGQGNYSFSNLVAGTYKICEVQQTGWIVTHPATTCQNVTIDVSGETETANFGNQGRGTITVKKELIPSNDPGKFNLQIDGTTYATNVGNGGTTAAIDVPAGDYNVSELAGLNTTLDDYSTIIACEWNASRGGEFEGTYQDDLPIEPGDNLVCTFKNTRKTGTLTIVKAVTNDNGGKLGANDFGLTIDGQAATSGQAVTLTTGTHSFNETQQTGYAFEKITGAGCPASLGGNVIVVSNQNVTCTITNNDIAPQLTVIKKVVNTNTNLTKTSANFTMNVTGTNVNTGSFAGADTPGTTVTLSAGSYNVGESADSNYTASYSTDCNSKIAIGETKSCTVTNTAILKPAIKVVKSGQDTAYEGDKVTYAFTVTNPGNTPLDSLTVLDNVAGNDAELKSGDLNSNNKLDPGETWIYNIDYTIPAGSNDITNRVDVCGYDIADTKACSYHTHKIHVYHPMINVTKQVVTSQEGDDGTFNLQIDSNTLATGGNGKTTGNVLVTPGTHSVGETGANGTDLTDYDTQIRCYIGEVYIGTPNNTNLHDVTVTGDQHADCTIINTRHAHLTVVKDAVPNDPQMFDFTLDMYNECEQVSFQSLINISENYEQNCDEYTNVTNFQLQDNTDPTLATKTLSLSEGSYKLSELAAAGWDLTNLDCGDIWSEQEDGAVWLNLDAGQNVTCTYTNTKRSSLTIVKDAKPNSLQQFSFTSDVKGSESFSLMDDGTANTNSKTMSNLLPGTYKVTEGSLDNWTLDGVACGEDVTMKLDGHTLTVTLAPGANVTCTFTNNQAEVLGAVTPTVTPTLVNTGEGIWTNVIVGLTALLLTIGLALGARREQQLQK